MFTFADYARFSRTKCRNFVAKHKQTGQQEKPHTVPAMTAKGELIQHRIKQFEDYENFFKLQGAGPVIAISSQSNDTELQQARDCFHELITQLQQLVKDGRFTKYKIEKEPVHDEIHEQDRFGNRAPNYAQ